MISKKIAIVGGCILVFCIGCFLFSDVVTERGGVDSRLNVSKSSSSKIRSSSRQLVEKDGKSCKLSGVSSGEEHICDHCVVGANQISLDQKLLPRELEAMLIDDKDSPRHYISMNPDSFLAFIDSSVGEEVSVSLNQAEFVLQGTISKLKINSKDNAFFQGALQLHENGGEVFFSQTARGFKARILFKEKAAALVFKEGSHGPAFVKMVNREVYQ